MNVSDHEKRQLRRFMKTSSQRFFWVLFGVYLLGIISGLIVAAFLH
jgi:hypothetical protein